MKIKQKPLLLFLLSAALLFYQLAAAKTVNEEDLKAEFIFRFIQYTTWPEPLENTFCLCLIGESRVADAIERYSGRLIQGVPFTTVRRLSPAAIPEACNAVFISTQKRTELRSWLRLYGRQSILLISDAPGAFDENIDIALLTEPNRITFSINKTLAGSKMFSFSGQMLKLAQKIR